jgi:hypothetical protein
MYKNQSNIYDTNLFETYVGSLNLAPHKISGKYKIVIDQNLDLWLDDYVGRRVAIDTNQNFLPQVANFLQTKTQIVDYTKLHYGGFQDNQIKKYHIPFYINNIAYSPKYFVLLHTVSENIPADNFKKIYKYSEILKLINLEKIGIQTILEEIFAENYFNFPVYFNLEDAKIDIYGYSIDRSEPVIYSIDISHSLANQPYADVTNNLILNNFEKQNIIFPKFLNIEVEFEYSDNLYPFNNFYGFLSNDKPLVDIPEKLDEHKTYAKLREYDLSKGIDFEKVDYRNTFDLLPYINYLDTISIQALNIYLKPQIKFVCDLVILDDVWEVYDEFNNLVLSYRVKDTDIIKNSLFQTLIVICTKCNKLSAGEYLFTPNNLDTGCTVTIQSNVEGDNNEDQYIKIPKIGYRLLDRFDDDLRKYHFRRLSDCDILYTGSVQLIDAIKVFKINGRDYFIYDKFKYNNQIILRLNQPVVLEKITYGQLFSEKIEQLIELNPISFLKLESDFECYKQFDIDLYIEDLRAMFSNVVETIDYEAILTDFRDRERMKSSFQYSKEDFIKQDLLDYPVVTKYNDNQEIVKNLCFSSGSSTFFTPNILNFDKDFFVQNGNLIPNQLDADILRYNWFLIKGLMPEYCKDTILELRYFQEGNYPKITARIQKVTENYAECLFLGVKYQFPIKYINYQFATYISIDNKLDVKTNYKIEVDDERKLILLSINKYLDYTDLIRGGDTKLPSLIDTNFFYNISNKYNDSSDFMLDFQTVGIDLRIELSPDEFITFDNEKVYDWKYFFEDKWYVALFLKDLYNDSAVHDLRQIFHVGEDLIMYLYADIYYNGELFTYVTTTVTVTGIIEVHKDYIWCENIEFKFFDSEYIFITKYNITKQIDELFYIEKDKILNYTDVSDNIFGDYESLAVIILDQREEIIKLVLPKKVISLKEYYFEINQVITENPLGEKFFSKSVFRFPEFFKPEMTDDELIEQFEDVHHDEDIYRNRITIFDRNQVFNLLRNLLANELKVKYFSLDQIRRQMNEFMATNLIDYALVNSIPIVGSTEYLKLNILNIDKNIVIWNLLNEFKLNLIMRHRGSYLPYFGLYETELDFQLQRYKINNSIFNVYDNNFGKFLGIDNQLLALENPITATGLYEEVQGNIVSSFYCKDEVFKLKTTFKTEINYFKLLLAIIDIRECIITKDNKEYIETINQNIDEYITTEYVKFMFNFYYLAEVTNEYEQKISYTTDTQNQYNIKFQPLHTYTGSFKSLIIVLKRK